MGISCVIGSFAGYYLLDLIWIKVRIKSRFTLVTFRRTPTRRVELDAVSIRERAAEAEDRAVSGQWEGGLLSGSHNSQIATVVERHTRYVMLVNTS